jgi:hypothetical protein
MSKVTWIVLALIFAMTGVALGLGGIWLTALLSGSIVLSVVVAVIAFAMPVKTDIADSFPVRSAPPGAGQTDAAVPQGDRYEYVMRRD